MATTRTRRKADEATPATTDQPTPEAPAATPAPAATAAAGPDLKVVMVATALQAHQEGITGADLVAASGLQPAVVAKVLDAMELFGAARRLEPADGGEVERWRRVDAVDLVMVDVDNVPTECQCPTCGDHHRRRVVINVGATTRNGGGGNGTPGVNKDGSPKFGKGEAEGLILEFVTSRPDETFTYGSIARDLGDKLGRNISTGTTRNYQDKLLAKGILVPANPDDPHDRRTRLSPSYQPAAA